jgi:hypothetical protein
VTEGLLARGFGAQLELPMKAPWEFCFGEGYHSFVASCSEIDAPLLEAEWKKYEVPFRKIGVVTSQDQLRVGPWSVPVKQLRLAWNREGY